VEITWYGHCCFRLRGRGVSVVTDPYAPSLGSTLPRFTGTIVTISLDHEHHNNDRAVRGKPFVIAGPGEYEVDDVFVFGIPTHAETRRKTPPVKNTAYLIEIEGVKVCHLGFLDHLLTQDQIEALGDVNVLLVPVGGKSVLTGGRAAEVVGQIEPGIVIPMHYRVAGLDTEGETARRFLREMAVDAAEEAESLTVTTSQVPDATRVVMLKPRF